MSVLIITPSNFNDRTVGEDIDTSTVIAKSGRDFFELKVKLTLSVLADIPLRLLPRQASAASLPASV